jgi:phage terminase small subunit
MPVLSPKHEKFAQHLAQGETATDAYELAGYKPSRFNASKLANNPAVKERVIQITTKNAETAAKAAAVTTESLIEEAEALRAKAYESRQFSAAVSALREKGVLSGKRIERHEVGGPGEFDHLTDTELLAAIRERWARLDSETQRAIGNGSIQLNGAPRNPKDRDH